MFYDTVGLQSFFGGQSTDRKLGNKSQFYYGSHIDHRKNPNQFSVLPGTRQISAGDVVDLVEDMTQIPSGEKFALGDAGNVYRVTTSNAFSSFGTLGQNGGAGILYRADVDMVYITGTTQVSRIKNIATSPQFQQTWFQRGASTASACYKTGGQQTYSLGATVVESASTIRTFVADIEPFYSIKVLVGAKGTGDWTLTLHDDANNVLGSATVTTGNITNGQMLEFVFSSAVRALVSPNGRTYHFHLTSTVADGTVVTTTSGTLGDCDMELWANALIDTKNGLHPIMNFTNLTLIGNERYVAAYEPLQDSPTTSDFKRHRLTLPPGFEVCGFAQKNLMAIIAAEKRSTSGEFQEGALFFWDGTAETYNDWWPVPEGSPEALFSEKNVANYIAGGALYVMRGMESPTKVRSFRNTDSEYTDIADVTHVNPNMMTVRRGVLLVAYPTTTTNQSLVHGVYSMGAITREYPDSWGYNYTPSPGNSLNNGSNNLRIGMIKNYGDTLFMSWRDDSATPQKYGVDIVDNSSDPAPNFTLESLYFDNGQPYKLKKAGKIAATFVTLPDGVSVRLKYRLNRSSTWIYSDYTTSGDKIILSLNNQKFYGIEFGIEGLITGTTTPEITSLYLFFNPLKNEEEFNG